MKITLITVGKLKEKYWKSAIEEYSKRLSRYCRLDIREVADEKCPENASQADQEKVKDKEGERILNLIPRNALVVTLEIEGKSLSSDKLARWIDQVPHMGRDHICFIIGGSLGISPEVCRKSDMALSFSSMTFPHQMIRVILLEQIYRSFRIIRNEPYHK